MAAKFLNADLDVFSCEPLDILITEIGEQAFLLHGGAYTYELPFFARYEIDYDPAEKTPESLILAFCHLISNLSAESRAIWDVASHRVIDLGYEMMGDQQPRKDGVSPVALAQMASLGISLAWTFYTPDIQ